MNKLKASFLHIIKTAILVYIFILIAAFLFQNQLLFHPTAKTYPPASYGLEDFNQTTIRTADNVKLTAWYHHAPGNEKTILYFYGNADTLANYPVFFKKFADAGYNVLGINYRGYGGSKGKPSEAGLYLDGDAALKFLERYSDLQNIIVVGRSLGTGVAVEIASKNEIGGLALISPYTSINAVAEKVYWFLPVNLISRYKFDSLAKIASVKAPVLIIHGELDKLIPFSQAESLDKAVKNKHQLIKYAGGGHLLMDQGKLADDIINFFGEANNHADQ